MSPRSEQQNAALRAATEKLLMEAALALFARYGYERTSVRMIAEQAGISVGLLYNYFEGKDALLNYLFLKGLEDFRESLHRRVGEVNPGEMPGRLLPALLQLVGKQAGFWRLYYSLRMQPATADLLPGQLEGLTGILRKYLEGYFRQQGVPNAEAETLLLSASIDGILQQYLLDLQNYPADRVLRTILTQYQ